MLVLIVAGAGLRYLPGTSISFDSYKMHKISTTYKNTYRGTFIVTFFQRQGLEIVQFELWRLFSIQHCAERGRSADLRCRVSISDQCEYIPHIIIVKGLISYSAMTGATIVQII
jgi:hypothetical protein